MLLLVYLRNVLNLTAGICWDLESGHAAGVGRRACQDARQRSSSSKWACIIATGKGLDNCNLGAGSIVTTLGAGSSLPCLQLSCIRNHSCAMQAGTPPPPTLWTPST